MTYQNDDFILVGNFGRPIGLKGSLKLNSFTRPTENIKTYESFFVSEEKTFKKLDITKISSSGKNLVIFVSGCNSLEQAEKYFKGKDIYISKSELPKLSKLDRFIRSRQKRSWKRPILRGRIVWQRYYFLRYQHCW